MATPFHEQLSMFTPEPYRDPYDEAILDLYPEIDDDPDLYWSTEPQVEVVLLVEYGTCQICGTYLPLGRYCRATARCREAGGGSVL